MSDINSPGAGDIEPEENTSDKKKVSITIPPITRPGREKIISQTSDRIEDRSESERLEALQNGEGIKLSAETIESLIEARTFGASAIYRRIRGFKEELSNFFDGVRPTLPPTLRGELLNPDGQPAKRIFIEVIKPVYTQNEGVSEISWTTRRATTDKRGIFSIDLSPVPAPQNGLSLRLRGQNTVITLNISRTDSLDGDIGLVVLENTLIPLQQTVFGELANLFPVDETDTVDNIEDFRTHQPPLMLGEEECAHEYATEGGTISRFRYSLLYRLIDPLLGPKLITRQRISDGRRIISSIPTHSLANAEVTADEVISAFNAGEGEWSYRDRQPIEDPIDIDKFFGDLETDPKGVPKAATLGLGYITKMRVIAINQGLSLGTLVYSLPLAPGEEQQVAVFDQTQQLSVRERESLSFSEQQDFEESQDISMDAVFSSALSEIIHEDSKFNSNSNTGISSEGHSLSSAHSAGAGLLLAKFSGSIAGAYSSNFSSTTTNASGNASSNQNTTRNFLSETHETFTSSLHRRANIKRRASRTGVRLATARDRQISTTKFVANRNHCHALTMQWFQVLRDYMIDSRVEGVQLVCFVPLQLVRFQQNIFGGETLSQNPGRFTLLSRYHMILRYADILKQQFRSNRKYRQALSALEKFAADPNADLEQLTPETTAQDVINFTVRGAFLPNDDISVLLVTQSGNRVGPITISGTPINIDNEFMKARGREQLIQYLQDLRTSGSTDYNGTLALPKTLSRSDIARIEILRRTKGFAYRYDGGPDAPRPFEIVSDIVKNTKNDVDLSEVANIINRLLSTSLSATEFEDLVGAPSITNVEAVINSGLPDELELTIGFSEATLPPRLALPVLTSPALSRRELIQIEEMYQHVVRNVVTYSKAVWFSMTSDERAILLERFTLGIPEGGIEDASQEIPLLSAVANKVLGFYGNMMIMPFHIPADLAHEMMVTTGDIQDALLRFHREGFRPPRSRISLPTRGLLGEAVLGRCNSCEKIDHRRFWNWKDSPTPQPVSPGPSFQQGGESIFSAQAPSTLVSNPPPANFTVAGGDVNQAASPNSSLAEILKAAPQLAQSGADLTSLEELQKLLSSQVTTGATGRDKGIEVTSDLLKTMTNQAVNLVIETMKQQNEALGTIAENSPLSGSAGEGDQENDEE